jgi:hypothetical protein
VVDLYKPRSESTPAELSEVFLRHSYKLRSVRRTNRNCKRIKGPDMAQSGWGRNEALSSG